MHSIQHSHIFLCAACRTAQSSQTKVLTSCNIMASLLYSMPQPAICLLHHLIKVSCYFRVTIDFNPLAFLFINIHSHCTSYYMDGNPAEVIFESEWVVRFYHLIWHRDEGDICLVVRGGNVPVIKIRSNRFCAKS